MKLKSTYVGLCNANHIDRVYTDRVKDRIRELTDLYDHVIDAANAAEHAGRLGEIDVAFSAWGMPAFTQSDIKTYFPNLKVLFYGGGTVQEFARAWLNCGVRIVSGWGANAVAVAEFAASQILLANKGFFQCLGMTKRDYRAAHRYVEGFPGNYKISVGILGAGMIGRLVIGHLKKCEIDILVFDPFLGDGDAVRLGVRKATLHEIFARCQTVSNHLANKPETVGLLNREHFGRMLPNATFINTGRGAQVVERDLIEALKAEPGRSAVLDVTWPEPPAAGSELFTLGNVFLTPHVAGSVSCDVERHGIYMLEEFLRYSAGEKMKYEVDMEMLKTLA
jgi:phosphoglycerate dehydrogenase-like enzyme